MNLMNITEISRFCGFIIALLVLAVVLPTADAQDSMYDVLDPTYFELGPKPPNVVPEGWSNNTNGRTTENPTVWMPDANLRAAVEAELTALDPPLTLTKTNLSVLSSINAAGTTDANGINHNPITNLNGLEYATNLTWLNLHINNITNLTTLSGLTNLTNLDLGWNSITNVTSLSGLTNLERLSISSNSINSISALSSLTNMERLEFSANAITDISTLSTLTGLTHLYLSGNNVSDISVLSNFTELEHLNFYDNNYDSTTALNITVIADLTNLTLLSLGRNSIDDIADLSSLTNLTDLYLESNNITDFSILSGLTNLERLTLSDNNIDDADITNYLSGMTHLEMLFLSHNDISNITDLSDMINLKVLTLQHNNISDISPLSDMVNLELLALNDNNISDISPLSDMANLELLYLRENRIPMIGVLVNLDSLEKVDLTVNPVWDNNTNRNTLADLYARSVEVLIDDLVSSGIGTPSVIEPGVSFTVPSDPQNGPFDVDVVFTEEVSGFELTELNLVPANIAFITSTAFTTTDNITYTATITPSSSGILTFSVAAGVARDASYNLNTAATSDPVTIDMDAPGVSIIVPSGTQSAPFDVNVVFTESVSDFVQEDLTLGGTGTARITDFDTTDDTTYTIEITPVIDGNITFSVAAGVARDASYNLNTAATSQTVTIDIDVPGVSVTVPSGTQNASFDVDVVFTEEVSDFVREDLTLGGTGTARITDFDTTDDTTYTVEILPIIDGDITFSVAAGVATDTAGNENTATTITQTVIVNVVEPEVSVIVPSGTQNAPFRVGIYFTVPVSGFEKNDIALSGTAATVTNFFQHQTNKRGYTAGITPTDTTPGSIRIDVPAGVAINAIGTPNAAATTQTVSVDLPPQVSFDIPSGTQYGAFIVQIIFSEPVTSFIADDIIISGSATAEVLPSTGSTASVYNVRITPTSQGSVTIHIPSNTARDTGNNGNPATTSESISVDLDFVITVPDTYLAAELRDQLNLNHNDNITKSQILTLTSFDYILPPRNEWIYNISGLEHAANLESLNLRGNRVSNIDVIQDLTNLTSLRLRGNRISNINVIQDLTNLTYLDLKNNNLTDINALAELRELRVLFLQGNRILDTSPLYPLLQSNGENLRRIDIDVSEYPPWDVNEDGSVDATDSALVTAALGQTGNAIVDPNTDVNSDGAVDQDDLTLVTDNLDADEAAPSSSGLFAALDQETLMSLDRNVLESYLNTLRAESDGSLKYERAIAILERVLVMTRPKQTQLLANYPNPFNPETWIPYHLANASKVRITIYDVHGTVVRRLDLGHQREGYYTNRSRAAYWDGRNDSGERVASGVYFYQLQADNTSLLRKMVILK